MKAVLLLGTLLLLAACTQQAEIANPASTYCEEQGGSLEIRTAGDGSQAGYCTLKNGTVCEEWAYYRGECGAQTP